MSSTPPVHARVLPVGPNTSDPDNFDPLADDFIAELRPFGVEMNALGDNVFGNAESAHADAILAGQRAGDAITAAASAAGAAAAASLAADAATTKAIQAAASATAAASSIDALKSTSATDDTIGMGVMNFVTQTGKAYQIGTDVKAADQANSGNAVYGSVVSYSGPNLQILVTSYDGAGLVSDWNITVSGQRGKQGLKGDTGGVNGGNLTGPLNALLAGSLATSSTLNPWTNDNITIGNVIPVTGSVPVINFAPAPQPGAMRTLRAVDGFPLANNVNITVFGGSTSLAAGDEVEILALTTTTFRAFVRRKSGEATVAPPVYPPTRNTIVLTSTIAYVALVTGWHRVHLVGGSARSGRAFGPIGRATGAGAPGLCVKWVYLIAGTSYMLTVGAGAPAVATTSGAIAGADGGASTFAAPDGMMIANGGGAGEASISAVVNLSGGAGGAASGGDLNLTGGRGGNISVTGSPGTSNLIATGSGALALFGLGHNGGDVAINLVSAGTSPVYVATGGAGVKGKGGDVSINIAGSASTAFIFTAGGGAGGGAATVTTNTAAQALGGVNAIGDASPLQTNQVVTLLAATAGGAPSVSGVDPIIPAPGGGSAGADILGGGKDQPPGGALAGTGGTVARNSTPNTAITAPGARFGVSNGGLAALSIAYANAVTGTGFSGFAIIEAP